MLSILSFLFFRKKKENQSLKQRLISTLPLQKLSETVITQPNVFKAKVDEISNHRSPATYSDIENYLPSQYPSALKNRWSQKVAYEDDLYVTSQLYLDDRPLYDYFFKWKKIGTSLSFVAGEFPEIKELAASFPSKDIQSEKINDVLDDKATLLSYKEIWILNSKGRLLPFLKIEIQRNEKPQRRNGHEYWIYDLLNESVTKTIQADRY